jgi:hypothetical protein
MQIGVEHAVEHYIRYPGTHQMISMRGFRRAVSKDTPGRTLVRRYRMIESACTLELPPGDVFITEFN